MQQPAYGSHGFHQQIEQLPQQFRCELFHIGFGNSPNDRQQELSNAQRKEAEYLFHYTTAGVGSFRDDSKAEEYLVPVGSAFLIPIPSHTSYRNLPPQNWECIWIFFNGALAGQLVEQLITHNNGKYIFQQQADGPSIQALHKLHRLRLSGELHPAQSSGILFEILNGLFCPDQEPVPPAIQQACHFINQYFNNPDLNVHMLASACDLSRSYFSRAFTRSMGCNPNTYITSVRLHKAVDLILGSHHKMKDIASMVGFAEPGYFNAVFKKTYGYPPGQIGKSRK